MPPKQPLKILFLHGYTQSGSLFHAKSRALLRHLQTLFPLHEIIPSYPTGPIRLDPADVPGQQPSPGSPDEKIQIFGWWRQSETACPPLYSGIEDGLTTIARTLRDEGPFDGVIGFSQGAALAAMVASLLETGRRDSFDAFEDGIAASRERTEYDGPVAKGIEYPVSFAGIDHPPMKFVICYSGFRAPGPRYRGFYEPEIQSPVLHVLGSLDAVVEHGRTWQLIEACEGDAEDKGRVVWHPGGHFLPSQRPFLDAAARFIKGRLEGGDTVRDEEDVFTTSSL